jgi:ABC-type glycerol-3-phosphate transport system permease component
MKIARLAGGAYVAAFAVFVLLPVYWALLTTLRDGGGPPGWESFLPRRLTLDGYDFLGSAESWTALRNSALVATATAVASVAIGIPAAYAIARLRRGGAFFLAALVLLRLLPPVALILPAFLLANRYHLADTLAGLVVFYIPFTLTFTVLLGFAYFRQVPPEIEEAALVDGCTRWGVLRLIVAPLAAPTMLAAGILAFAFAWTEFFVAAAFFRTEALTLPVHVAYHSTYGCFACVPRVEPLQLCLIGLTPSVICGLLLYRYVTRRVHDGN